MKQPKQIESYYQRLAKKEQDDAQREARKQKIYDIARDHFGYDIDLRDSR